MYKKLSLLAGTIVLAFGAGAQAQTKWDLPTAYPASNLHVENLTQFVKDVDSLSGGKLKITLHNNASLYKAPEIKRAVQGNQAQIGEILLTNFANEAGLRTGWPAVPGHRLRCPRSAVPGPETLPREDLPRRA